MRAGESFVPPEIFGRGKPFRATERSAAAFVSRLEAKAAAALPILDTNQEPDRPEPICSLSLCYVGARDDNNDKNKEIIGLAPGFLFFKHPL